MNKYQIDESLCTGCGQCVGVCPARATTLSDKACITIDRCIGCGVCVTVCRQGAIIEIPVETMQENVSLPVATATGVAGGATGQCRSDITGNPGRMGRGRGRGMKGWNERRR